MSFETTGRKLTGTVQTWRGVVFRPRNWRGEERGRGRASSNRKSSVVDSRQPCTTDDQWLW